MSFLWEILLCIGYIFKHKYYVFKYGLKLKVPLYQLIVHDLSKFHPAEFPWHIQKNNERIGRPFKIKNNYPLKHHFDWNKHHSQHYILVNGHTEYLEMPEKYIREQIADWLGAAAAKNNSLDVQKWYFQNKYKIRLHSKSRKKLEEILLDLKIDS